MLPRGRRGPRGCPARSPARRISRRNRSTACRVVPTDRVDDLEHLLAVDALVPDQGQPAHPAPGKFVDQLRARRARARAGMRPLARGSRRTVAPRSRREASGTARPARGVRTTRRRSPAPRRPAASPRPAPRHRLRHRRQSGGSGPGSLRGRRPPRFGQMYSSATFTFCTSTSLAGGS